MIYGRFGGKVTIVRRGTLEDVRTYENRKPDAIDKQNVNNDCYVVVRHEDDGKERLTAIAFLRADGGFGEIMDALRDAREADHEDHSD